jgi:hypothetical protein
MTKENYIIFFLYGRSNKKDSSTAPPTGHANRILTGRQQSTQMISPMSCLNAMRAHLQMACYCQLVRNVAGTCNSRRHYCRGRGRGGREKPRSDARLDHCVIY